METALFGLSNLLSHKILHASNEDVPEVLYSQWFTDQSVPMELTVEGLYRVSFL